MKARRQVFDSNHLSDSMKLAARELGGWLAELSEATPFRVQGEWNSSSSRDENSQSQGRA